MLFLRLQAYRVVEARWHAGDGVKDASSRPFSQLAITGNRPNAIASRYAKTTAVRNSATVGCMDHPQHIGQVAR